MNVISWFYMRADEHGMSKSLDPLASKPASSFIEGRPACRAPSLEGLTPDVNPMGQQEALALLFSDRNAVSQGWYPIL